MWVYDVFETTGIVEIGAPCVAVGDITGLREGGRVILRKDGTASVTATGEMEAGTVQYDATGPDIGADNHELFFYCEFPVPFEGVDLSPGDTYFFEFPGGSESSSVLTGQDLIDGRVTAFSNEALEAERQTLRLED